MLDMLVGFAAAMFAGLGVGGGGLLVIYLVLCKGLPQLEAQGINLLFFVLSSSASLAIHLKKRKIPLKVVCIIASAGIVGSLLACRFVKEVSSELLRKLFGVLLVISGAISLFKHEK